jgi:hypothetical protein
VKDTSESVEKDAVKVSERRLRLVQELSLFVNRGNESIPKHKFFGEVFDGGDISEIETAFKSEDGVRDWNVYCQVFKERPHDGVKVSRSALSHSVQRLGMVSIVYCYEGDAVTKSITENDCDLSYQTYGSLSRQALLDELLSVERRRSNPGVNIDEYFDLEDTLIDIIIEVLRRTKEIDLYEVRDGRLIFIVCSNFYITKETSNVQVWGYGDIIDDIRAERVELYSSDPYIVGRTFDERVFQNATAFIQHSPNIIKQANMCAANSTIHNILSGALIIGRKHNKW